MMRLRRAGTVMALVVALVCVASAQRAGENDKQFQAALQKEMVAGDLKGAIEEYRRIADRPGVDRGLAAQALLRMAECYEKLGDAQAPRVFSRIVQEYGDQPAANEARARLAAAGNRSGATAGAGADTSRVVWSSGSKVGPFGGGLVSRDGRWLPYTDWSTGNLALHDLVQGRDIPLTDTARPGPLGQQEYAGYSRVSPDGTRVVFSWFNSERYEIRLLEIGAEPGPGRPRTLYVNAEVPYIHPFDWSPDGRVIAVELQRLDRTGQIALLSLADGKLTTLKSFPWRDESTVLSFSPDGLHLAYDLPSEDPTGERDIHILGVDGRSPEVQVTAHRRSDRMVAWSRDGRGLLFSSDRTGSVELWTQPLNGVQPQGDPRVIPSVFSGQFMGATDDGSLYDFKTTHSGSAFRMVDFDFTRSRASSTPVDAGEEFFSTTVFSLAEWSPDGRSLALARRAGGVVISVASADGARLTEVRPQLSLMRPAFAWASDAASVLVAGSDLKARPGLFRISLDSGETTPIVLAADGEVVAAPALARDGGELYYRHVTASAVRLVARTLESGTEREMVRWIRPTSGPPNGLRNPTLSPDGRQLAVLTGTADGSDVLSLVAVTSGAITDVLKAPAASLEVLMWAPDSRSVFVRRAINGREPEVLRVSVSGQEPVKVAWTLGDDSRHFRVHPGGTRLVYVVDTVATQSEVRVLPNVLGRAAISK